MVLEKHRCGKFVTCLVRQPTVQYSYYIYTGLDYVYAIVHVHVRSYDKAENASKLMKRSGLITETSTEETETSTRKKLTKGEKQRYSQIQMQTKGKTT